MAAAVALGKGTRTRLPCWHYVPAAAHMERSRLALKTIQHVNHDVDSTCSSSDSAACVRCCDGCGRHVQSARHHVIVDQQIAYCREQRLDRMQPRWRSAGTWQAALLVAEERMAGQGSVAATARESGEKSNLLHERFPKLGAPLTIVLVCFA